MALPLAACALCLLAGTGFVGPSSGSQRRLRARAAASPAGKSPYGPGGQGAPGGGAPMMSEEDDMMRGIPGMDEMDDMDDMEIVGPPDEVLDAWEEEQLPAQILMNFQDPELQGKDLLSFRDVYRLLEIMGMDKDQFIDMFTEADGDDELGDSDMGDFDDGDFGDDMYGGVGAPPRGAGSVGKTPA